MVSILLFQEYFCGTAWTEKICIVFAKSLCSINHAKTTRGQVVKFKPQKPKFHYHCCSQMLFKYHMTNVILPQLSVQYGIFRNSGADVKISCLKVAYSGQVSYYTVITKRLTYILLTDE